ncbi:putative ribonuclease H protein [Nymphaea thermarum]|nr:putative ribonuclease H protein [Nymphaea thermarum]
MCKHRGTTLSSSTEAQAWKKVLVPKKAREGIQRSDPGEQRLHANRFATLSNHFHEGHGNDMGTNLPSGGREGSASSAKQKEVKRAEVTESKKYNKRGMKEGKDHTDGKEEDSRMGSTDKRLSNPFFSLTKMIGNNASDQAGPSRFRFVAESKDSKSAKGKEGDMSKQEMHNQGPTITGRQGEAAEVTQKGVRKSTRGLAKRPAQHELSLILSKFKPSIGFVLDSMITTRRIKVIMERYHTYRYVTNADSPDGVVRILCMWNEEEMEASHVVADQNWVGVSFHRVVDNKVFVVFGVYLPPRFGERLHSFYHLEDLVSRVEGPVLLIGDFNAMLSNCNKSGSAPSASSCLSFSRFIYACRLKEVEDRNKKFTWSNHRQGQDSVQCKLDWCLINDEWITSFGREGSLQVQTCASSDHCALIYQIRDVSDDHRGSKPFRFFKPWLMDQKGKDVMLEAWRGDVRGCPMLRLLIKLNRLRLAVLEWNKNSFGDLNSTIANLQASLEDCRVRVEQGIEGALDDEHRVRQQLSQALLMEEVMWKQRARIRWLAEGDKNTTFFHAMAKFRQAKRKIRILECDGIEYVHSSQILEGCTEYFKRVLAEDEAHGNLFDGIDNTPSVSESDNSHLLQPISEEEVTVAVWSLDKDSAAGPDGFPNYFYQECWVMVRWIERVMKCVSSVSYAVLVNGRTGEKFDGRRGLRQEYSALVKWQPSFGLPLFLGNLTEDICFPLLDKVEKRLAGWKARVLSYAGRICLIRYVLMTLPYYWMMAFRIPKVVLKRIEQVCIKFLWNEEDGSRHIHLIKWERLCLPIEEGGVGIRRLEEVNRVMLASRCCRMLSSKDPWANLFKEKYLSSHSLWTLKRSPSPSWGWKGLRWGWSWIQSRVEWKVGNGEKIRFWFDHWSGQVLIRRIDGNHYMLMYSDVNISISQLTRANHDSPSFALAVQIGASPANIRLRDTEDMLVWSDDGKESFKAGEILNKCRSQGVKEWWRRKLWVSYAPAKSCWHSYIACEGRLPTLDRIQKTGIHLANRCSFCQCEEETNAHVLINCKVAKEVWRYIAAKFDRVKFPQGSIAKAFKRWLQARIKEKWRRRCWRMTFLIVCWNLWCFRDRCYHDSLPPQVGRFKEDVWRNCIGSFSSIKWTTKDEIQLRIWIETGLNTVHTIGFNREGMLINIVRASTRRGPKIAGLSYGDDGQMGCAVIINARGRMHEGERAVLERILSFHKDYGGDYVIVSPIKEWVRKTRQQLEGRRLHFGWNGCLQNVHMRISVKQGDATVDIGRLIMEHTSDPNDYFADLKMYMLRP